MRKEIQAMLLAPRFHAAAEKNEKNMTIRKGHRDFELGDVFIICDKVSWCIKRKIVEVKKCGFNHLTDQDAQADGFVNTQALYETMIEFYPDFTPIDDVTLIYWE